MALTSHARTIGRTMLDPNWERNETERKVTTVLEQVAAQVGASNIQAGTSRALPDGEGS